MKQTGMTKLLKCIAGGKTINIIYYGTILQSVV